MRVWSNKMGIFLPFPSLYRPFAQKAEEEELLWRIGPLNCYNPMKPDRDYDLDLTHRDEREVCKVRVEHTIFVPKIGSFIKNRTV